MSTFISEAFCEAECNATLSALHHSSCTKRADSDMTAILLGGLTPTGLHDITGEDACEMRGLHGESCLEVGCCQYVDGHCHSAVGSETCILSAKAKATLNEELSMGMLAQADMMCELDAACPSSILEMLGGCMDSMAVMQADHNSSSEAVDWMCHTSSPCVLLDTALDSVDDTCKAFLEMRLSKEGWQMATMMGDMCQCVDLSTSSSTNPLSVCPGSVVLALAPMIDLSLGQIVAFEPPHRETMVGHANGSKCSDDCKDAIASLIGADGMKSMMNMMNMPELSTPAELGGNFSSMMCDDMVTSDRIEEIIEQIGVVTHEALADGMKATEQCPLATGEGGPGESSQILCGQYSDVMANVERNIFEVMEEAQWWTSTTTTTTTTITPTATTTTTTTTTTQEVVEVSSSFAHRASVLMLALGWAVAIGLKD